MVEYSMVLKPYTIKLARKVGGALLRFQSKTVGCDHRT